MAKLAATRIACKKPFFNLAIAAVLIAIFVSVPSFQSFSETKRVNASVSFDIDPNLKESFARSIKRFSIVENFLLWDRASILSHGRDWQVSIVRLERNDVDIFYHNLLSENKIFIAIYEKKENVEWEHLWKKILGITRQYEHVN